MSGSYTPPWILFSLLMNVGFSPSSGACCDHSHQLQSNRISIRLRPRIQQPSSVSAYEQPSESLQLIHQILSRSSLTPIRQSSAASSTVRMASNDSPAAAATAPSGEENRRLRTITIHILSPSLPAPNRFTINDLPIETTVGELRARITQALPSQPAPSTQRLIYQGRPLLNNTQMLSEVLGTVEVGLHPLQLQLASCSPDLI